MKAFTAHPHSKGYTYTEHAGASFSVATKMWITSMALVVHSVFPFLFDAFTMKHGKSAYERLLLEQRSVNVQKLMLQNVTMKRAIRKMTNDMCPEEAEKILKEIHTYEFD